MADIAESTSEKSSETSQMKLEKKFGQSPVFVVSTLLENGGVPRDASPASLLREAIQVISCGYEDKTEWGSEVSWLIIFHLEFSVALKCCFNSERAFVTNTLEW